MKFELKGNRLGKVCALVGTLALCLTLAGCYIPPDEIQTGTENMTVGRNNLPFDPIPTATQQPTQAPAQAPTDAPAQPTINWDDWGSTTTSAPVNTDSGNAGTIVVVTQAPTATPKPTTATTAGTAATVLKKGATGDAVRTLQKRLKELGYLSGSADGDFGDATETAVKAFQQASGLTADGVVGTKTLQKLNSSDAKKNTGSSVNNNSGNTIAVVTVKPTTKPTAKPTAKPTSTPKVDNVYLEVGSSGTKVRTLQNRLIELGWLAGSADGEYGGATQAAVKAFQEKSGLWADGVAGPDTLEKLYSSSARKSSTPAAVAGSSLKEGMNGDGVRALQRRLKTLGYYAGSIDGDYGEATKNAVIAFQRTQGLTADGVAGTSTLNKLFQEDLKTESESKAEENKVSSTGYITLEQGDEGAGVKKLQQALKTMGYYSGSVDGSYGTGTVNAVMAFQRMNNLTVDGVAGPATQRVLYGTGTSISYSTLREGESGSAVRTLQYTLYELGYYDGKIDGDYGETTKDAVRAFQIQNDLSPVDGIAGNKTQQKLYSSSAKSATSPNTSFNTLREGSKGSAVIELQEALVNLGYLSNVTGEYDASTTAAVKLFQTVNNLSPVDGVAGAATQQKLYSDSAKSYGN